MTHSINLITSQSIKFGSYENIKVHYHLSMGSAELKCKGTMFK